MKIDGINYNTEFGRKYPSSENKNHETGTKTKGAKLGEVPKKHDWYSSSSGSESSHSRSSQPIADGSDRVMRDRVFLKVRSGSRGPQCLGVIAYAVLYVCSMVITTCRSAARMARIDGFTSYPKTYALRDRMWSTEQWAKGHLALSEANRLLPEYYQLKEELGSRTNWAALWNTDVSDKKAKSILLDIGRNNSGFLLTICNQVFIDHNNKEANKCPNFFLVDTRMRLGLFLSWALLTEQETENCDLPSEKELRSRFDVFRMWFSAEEQQRATENQATRIFGSDTIAGEITTEIITNIAKCSYVIEQELEKTRLQAPDGYPPEPLLRPYINIVPSSLR